jgi:hypothetical protein
MVADSIVAIIARFSQRNRACAVLLSTRRSAPMARRICRAQIPRRTHQQHNARTPTTATAACTNELHDPGVVMASGWLCIKRMQLSSCIIASCGMLLHELIAVTSASDMFIRCIIAIHSELFILSAEGIDMQECIVCRSVDIEWSLEAISL